MKIVEFDVIFLSYDEPNAEINYADLCSKVPWAKRVHGVKGSDAAHKAAANKSDTDWFVTVDADNIIDTKFFDVDVDTTNSNIEVYSWCGKNKINGLTYGNGGLKLWKKDFVLDMRTHEESTSSRAQVDFCWENKYVQFPKVYSQTVITGSPFQAWRAGFREGVKMTLHDGEKVDPSQIHNLVWWHNLHRLNIWATIGSHEENGLFSILGARMGAYLTNCTDWDYVQVRDFEHLSTLYQSQVSQYESDKKSLIEKIKEYGTECKNKLGFNWPYLDSLMSQYSLDLYSTAIELDRTYREPNV